MVENTRKKNKKKAASILDAWRDQKQKIYFFGLRDVMRVLLTSSYSYYFLLGQSSKDEDDKTYLTDDFYYERPTSLFNPSLTEGVPRDLLSLQYPFYQ